MTRPTILLTHICRSYFMIYRKSRCRLWAIQLSAVGLQIVPVVVVTLRFFLSLPSLSFASKPASPGIHHMSPLVPTKHPAPGLGIRVQIWRRSGAYSFDLSGPDHTNGRPELLRRTISGVGGLIWRHSIIIWWCHSWSVWWLYTWMTSQSQPFDGGGPMLLRTQNYFRPVGIKETAATSTVGGPSPSSG